MIPVLGVSTRSSVRLGWGSVIFIGPNYLKSPLHYFRVLINGASRGTLVRMGIELHSLIRSTVLFCLRKCILLVHSYTFPSQHSHRDYCTQVPVQAGFSQMPSFPSKLLLLGGRRARSSHASENELLHLINIAVTVGSREQSQR